MQTCDTHITCNSSRSNVVFCRPVGNCDWSRTVHSDSANTTGYCHQLHSGKTKEKVNIYLMKVCHAIYLKFFATETASTDKLSSSFPGLM